MTDSPLKLGFTKDGFSEYVEKVVAPKMSAWRPRGVVLHNTWAPDLKTFEGYIASGKWKAEQLVENWWTRYRQLGWRSGPHLFVARDKIWLGSALWTRGTHSPSFNSTHWAVELIGNYSIEILPDEIRDNAVSAIADLYAMLGHEPSLDNFKYHGEDPRTSHKLCPGKNVGGKLAWIDAVRAEMQDHAPGEHEPATVVMPVISQPLKGTPMPEAPVPQVPMNMASFEAAYKAALPDEFEEAKKDSVKKHAEAGMAAPTHLFDSAVTLGNFCTQWPKVKFFLNGLISFASWWSPGPAAMAKSFIAAFEAAVLPIVCPVPPAE